MDMKSCPQHRHQHRQLACPQPDCPNAEGTDETVYVPRHMGAGALTSEEHGFEGAPPPRVFHRRQWQCEQCGVVGWAWVEAGAEMRMDRCPHRRTSTVRPVARGVGR